MEQTYSIQDVSAALQDYQNQTGNSLIDHPFSGKLEKCNSVDSIIAVLQEKAQIFDEFEKDNKKIIKSIKSVVVILYTLSNTTVLGGDIGLVRSISLIGVSCSQSSLYSYSSLRMQYILASPSCFPYVPFSDPICKSP